MIILLNSIAHTFAYSNRTMLLDGEPFQMISGEIHPSRVPYQFWRHRIQMAKAFGVNTISFYVFWNKHVTQNGFDFSSQQNNLSNFVQICEEEGLFVSLRPGPYVCGEWDFGGFPAYLLKNSNMKVRSLENPVYVAEVQKFIKAVSQHFQKWMYYNGGNILQIQLENEYAYWNNTNQTEKLKYMQWLKEQFTSNGITGPYYTSDPMWQLSDGVHLPGTAIGLNGAATAQNFEAAWQIDEQAPVFVTELYPMGSDVSSNIQYYMDNKLGFSFYMLHGGTNFGTSAGAHKDDLLTYRTDWTVYNDAAPINQRGLPGDRFYQYRQIIWSGRGQNPINIPDAIPSSHAKVKLTRVSSIWDQQYGYNFINSPQNFEFFGKNQGYMIYKTQLPVNQSGVLEFQNVHDYAQVYLNGQHLATMNQSSFKIESRVAMANTSSGVLEVLVEGLGHTGWGQYIPIDRKGVWGSVLFNNQSVTKWEHYLFDLIQIGKSVVIKDNFPNRMGGIFASNISIQKLGDIYLDMRNYFAGMVFVNGESLGRYRTSWPDYCLYVPSAFLRLGLNQIVVIDTEMSTVQEVTACDSCGQCNWGEEEEQVQPEEQRNQSIGTVYEACIIVASVVVVSIITISIIYFRKKRRYSRIGTDEAAKIQQNDDEKTE